MDEKDVGEPINTYMELVDFRTLFILKHSIKKRFYNVTIDDMAKYGLLNLIKQHPKRKLTTNAMNWAAENGHLEVLKFLHSIGAKCTTEAMNWAAGNGHLKVLRNVLQR